MEPQTNRPHTYEESTMSFRETRHFDINFRETRSISTTFSVPFLHHAILLFPLAHSFLLLSGSRSVIAGHKVARIVGKMSHHHHAFSFPLFSTIPREKETSTKEPSSSEISAIFQPYLPPTPRPRFVRFLRGNGYQLLSSRTTRAELLGPRQTSICSRLPFEASAREREREARPREIARGARDPLQLRYPSFRFNDSFLSLPFY